MDKIINFFKDNWAIILIIILILILVYGAS